MMYNLLNQLIFLVQEYEASGDVKNQDVALFGQWLNERNKLSKSHALPEPEWQGKEQGRTAESVINTSLVHLYRYARLHAKAAVAGSAFATPDELIYLINLRALGSMTKTALIRLNVHEKSAGIQIINRLIANGMAEQLPGHQDKRNKIISITDQGSAALDNSMARIRKASVDVTGNITHQEKMDLIRILSKLEDHHLLASRNLLL